MIKQYLSYSGIQRIFLGLFITIFLGVNVGSYFLYSFSLSILLSEINTGTLRTLTKIRNGTELIYNEIVSLTTRLAFGDITLTKMMFENERDRLLEYQGHQIMQQAVVSHPYIDFIGIYNERLDEIMATFDFMPESRNTLKNIVHRYFRRSANNLTLPISLLQFSNGSFSNSLALIYYSPLSLEYDKGALIIGIKCNYFRQLIQQMDKGELETVIILHGNRQVISHPNEDQELVDYGNVDYVRQIMDAELKTGFFIQKINKIETYISFTYSEMLDWTFISMTPYKNIVSALNSLRLTVLLVTFIILCIGIFISYFMAVTTYRPIYSLLKRFNYIPIKKGLFNTHVENTYIEQEIEKLRSTANMSEILSRNHIILNLLSTQNIDDGLIDLKILETAFISPFYFVSLVSFDEWDVSGNRDTKEHDKLQQGLVNIANELLERCCVSMDYALVHPGDVAFVLHLDDGVYPPDLIPLIMELGTAVKKFYNQTVSVAIGPIVNSIFAINDSFEKTEIFLRERFFKGSAIVVMKESITPHIEIPYPRTMGEELCTAVLSGDIQKIEYIIKNFKIIIGQTTYDYAQMYINTIIMQLLSYCLSRGISVDANSFHHLSRDLQGIKTLEKACNELYRFCISLAEDLRQRADGALPPLIRDSLCLVEERYAESLFNVNTAADHFNITPSYFNRLFKKYIGLSFSEYLNDHRMKVACSLLLTTNYSIGSIPEAVGISNVNYFYTLFKKIHNLTPQQFRQRRAKK
jgi:AraC-like DNA-binding protein